MRKTLIIAIVALVAAASCGGDGSRAGAGISGSLEPPGNGGSGAGAGISGSLEPPGDGGAVTAAATTVGVIELGSEDVVLTAGLVRFDDCDALLDYLRAEYSARVGMWGFDDGGWFRPLLRTLDEAAVPDMVAEEVLAEAAEAVAEAMAEEMAVAADAGAAAPAATVAARAAVEGVDFSGTNVQEAGVDEADIVKTDGNRIFALSSGRLVVVDAASRSVVGSVAVAEGWGRELFIDGDSLLLITRSDSDSGDGSETVLQRIDAGGDTPEIVGTLNVQGSYVSARSVGGLARVVLRYDPQWNFPFVYPQDNSEIDPAKAANRAAVLNSTLDDWLPHYTVGSADSSTGSLLVPCGDVHAPSVFSGFGVTTVISVPIGGDFDASRSTAVMAPGDTVYASTGSLYVATTRWPADIFDDVAAWEDAWRRRRTSIHRFDITGPEAAYEASGAVLGVIHNQFSLSEHAGHLRVVTTAGGPWGEDSESWVRVLSTDGDALVEVGSVGDIGRGDQVQSVRFVGDVGYVVTFRQIDPFYTIDLSDPANPAVLGELKIPGFSSYLHPISDTLVLGVGSDADPEGRITGAKVSLFDVSDLAEPREVAVWTAPDGWNDVGWDHRAFLWWAPENLAVIPVTVWDDWSGAVVLRVVDGIIIEVGRVDHFIEGEEPDRTDCRRLTEADLPTTDMDDFTTQLEYEISDRDSAVLACEPGEPGITGFDCYKNTFLDDDARVLDLLRDGESISWCWPSDQPNADQPNAIVRSIVIDDDLWTLSSTGWDGFDDSSKARLHANDLRTLERLAALVL